MELFAPLVRILKRSEGDMLEKFINEYSERAYHFAYKLCGDAEEAKELVQEAFFKVIRGWDKFDPSQPLDGWFFTVLRNVYVDGCKRYERRHRVSLDTPLAGSEQLTVADTLPDAGEEAALDRLQRQEAGEIVRRAMEFLRPDYRALLDLCDFQGLTYSQVAKVLDCPLGTVRSRMNRARAALKAALLEQMPNEVKEYAM